VSDKLRIILSGMIAADPGQGGAAWAVLQYALGFRRLGHDVLLVEQWDPGDEVTDGHAAADSPSAAYFSDVVERFGLAGRAALLVSGSEHTVGLPYARLVELARGAELLVNISGTLTDDELFSRAPTRAYLDLDPAFNQLWATEGIDMRFSGHTHFVTVGQAIGTAGCPIPTCGLEWITTLPPVVLEEWPPTPGGTRYTTVGNWRGYGSVEQDGVHYGQKAHSMRELVALSSRVGVDFLMAFAIHAGETRDLDALEHNGWELADPARVAATPCDYRRFVQGSRAELGVAKSGYVLSRSGWFSDRSTCYLASGKPVIAQETGFSRFLPTGEGLLPFEGVDDAAAAIEQVESDYDRHAHAARELAEAHFDSDKVLASLVEKLAGR
jgi:hypothetical protein